MLLFHIVQNLIQLQQCVMSSPPNKMYMYVSFLATRKGNVWTQLNSPEALKDLNLTIRDQTNLSCEPTKTMEILGFPETKVEISPWLTALRKSNVWVSCFLWQIFSPTKNNLRFDMI